MATKLFTKTIELVQPAWSLGHELIDGIYVDGRFFEENIPIIGATLTLRVKPNRMFRWRTLAFVARTFENGQIGDVNRHHDWLPSQDDEWVEAINFGSAFYGMGINPYYWLSSIDLPTNIEVIYSVDYALEVEY